ncbi:hypothetical protein BLS_006640 [Venturia inaequalis]|uniref:Uncharacterized protein n=1 Tax=Venturia inaequalis TaxID=5025 RepID=A0A8H3UTQ2_VENIN|nr:hypothetical protein EG328_008979 [Venturia inaequalis]KAE9966975.1 hypothetical protein BLS_006640 [Venturia inaequalis]KAE9975585.1 hypothetical protein EG327_008410 [Venturia inaequalis]RDI81578.1 hypothetical protein Vi05172_g8303 [Venturia inaequalis]
MSNQDHVPPQAIPEHEIKQNSGGNLALQAAQKAWELRQAANAAGDPNAREEILAKAINKEIEAESFGKAAKYTQSGAFQGLAAGAGLGVQPGVTLGKVTGAIVGGSVATVTGLLGAGVGSVYGALNGPMWNLGEMASKGVRGVVGDFPNWNSTPSQRKALEKMVMQSKETQAPTKEELERMKAEAPDDMPRSWSQSTNDMTGWRPSMPSMPAMPSISQAGSALGLGGLGASVGWGGAKQTPAQPKQQGHVQHKEQRPHLSERRSNRPQPSARAETKSVPEPKVASKPKQAPTPKQAQSADSSSSGNTQSTPSSKKAEKTAAPGTSTSAQTRSKLQTQQKSTQDVAKRSSPNADNEKASPKPATASIPVDKSQISPTANKESKTPVAPTTEKRKPRKLAPKNPEAQSKTTPAVKRKPPKLERRKPAA